MVRRVFTEYNAQIKANLAAKSPLARRYFVAAAAKKRDDALLRDVPIQELVENPDIFDAKGISRQAYEDDILSATTLDFIEGLE